MELRHLRYFIAVAEEGSLSTAAEVRLHTAQPSLSRQIRDLEQEVGVKLFERKARGIALTPAGRIFLDHARMVMLQVETAGEAARRAAQPEKPGFSVGFLIGQEATWLPEILRVLRDVARDIEVTIISQSSPELALSLMRGRVDVALIRREKEAAGLQFRPLFAEPLLVAMPRNHRLAAAKAVSPQDLMREILIGPSRAAPMLRAAIDDYATRIGIALKYSYDADNLSVGMSLLAATGGLFLMPLYGRNLLTPDVVVRPLEGDAPTIELVLAFSKSNTSRYLKQLLARLNEVVSNVQEKAAGFGFEDANSE